MSKIKDRLKTSLINNPDESKEYDYKKNLNWRDDGDELSDPSMNDYLKGYNKDPYQFTQWASVNQKRTKVAYNEVDVMEFNPPYLADKILKLWNQADGLLQDFYNAFTLRYSNKLKKEIAQELEKQGYKVYPLLIDDKPIYAKHKKIFKKVVASKNITNIMAYSKMFLRSKAVRSFVAELEQLQKLGEVSTTDASALIEYYKQIFPEDYALKLVNVMIDKPEKAEQEFDLYKDFSISDEGLNKIEDYMSGNTDPTYMHNGGEGGYDFTTDSRNDTTAPGNYEVTKMSSKKKD